MRLPKNPLWNHHTKHVLLPERLKADSTIEWIGELNIHWLMRNWFIEITRVSYNKQFFETRREFYTSNHISIKNTFVWKIIHNQCALKLVSEHIERFLQKYSSIHFLEQVWFNVESHHRCFPVVTWSLIQDGSHMSPTKSLRDVHSRRISIVIVNIFISLGCSANTTRIMGRTLNILSYFPHCVKQ